MKANATIEQHSQQIGNLYRQYRFIGPVSPAGVQLAYEKHGAPFMFKLLEILSEGQRGEYSNFSTTPPAGGYFSASGMSASGLQTAASAPTAATPNGSGGGKVFTWLNSILGAVNNTGQTIGTFKQSVFGPIQGAEDKEEKPTGPNYSQWILIALALILVILFTVMMFRKK